MSSYKNFEYTIIEDWKNCVDVLPMYASLDHYTQDNALNGDWKEVCVIKDYNIVIGFVLIADYPEGKQPCVFAAMYLTEEYRNKGYSKIIVKKLKEMLSITFIYGGIRIVGSSYKYAVHGILGFSKVVLWKEGDVLYFEVSLDEL